MPQEIDPVYKVIQSQLLSVNKKIITRLIVGDINTNAGRGVIIHGELNGFGTGYNIDEPLCVNEEQIEWMMEPNEYYHMFEVDDVALFVVK